MNKAIIETERVLRCIGIAFYVYKRYHKRRLEQILQERQLLEDIKQELRLAGCTAARVYDPDIEFNLIKNCIERHIYRFKKENLSLRRSRKYQMRYKCFEILTENVFYGKENNLDYSNQRKNLSVEN